MSKWREKAKRSPFYTRRLARYRRRIAVMQGGICTICGAPMLPDQEASIDHAIPYRWGGRDGPGNFLATHRTCNGAKGCAMPTGCELVMLLAVNARMGWRPVRW